MSALRTGATGVARIDEDHGYACQTSLVFDATSQVRKRPVAEATTKALSNRLLNAVADEGQILQRDADAKCLGFLDQTLTDRVVDVFLGARLPAAHRFQSSFGILRPLPLI